jgi:small-conductance mechanosensitive channel
MAKTPTAHPLGWLFAKLFATAAIGAFAYIFFTALNKRFLHGLSDPEVLALEAIVVVLIAYAVARAVTTFANALMVQRGAAAHGHAVRLFLNILVAIVAVVALSDLAGVSAESIFLGSAFAGIVLGLAAQTVLANVFAGLLLVFADPFRPGDHVAFVSSSFPALAPSYPHELQYPIYAGTIEDVGLVYTVLRLDVGGIARLPNSVVISSMVLQPRGSLLNSHRVRMTFPLTTEVATVESALPEIVAVFPRSSPFDQPPRFEIADISATTWDGVFSVSSAGRTDGDVRDVILRLVLARIPGAAPAKPAGAPP